MPINPKEKDVSTRPGELKGFSKSPWECKKKKERVKWAEDAQGIRWAGEA